MTVISGELTAAQVRAVNLIEILKEEAEEEGREVPDPPETANTWSEADIRTYFENHSRPVQAPPPRVDALETTHTPGDIDIPRLPPADEEIFHRWFPGLGLSRTGCDMPKLRVLCFPNAGNAEDMFTNEGTGVRKALSPLLEWCRAHSAECLAPQYPGRSMRLKDPKITTAQEMAEAILPVVASKLYDCPWVLVAHSVGTWISYEFLMQCRAAGVPMPLVAFISAMPAPDIPVEDRPWRQQRTLNEEDFKEECRGWDISDVVFSAAMWPTYQPLLRADFTIFDEYEFNHGGAPAFGFPVFSYWGRSDRRVKEKHVREWERFTKGAFKCEAIEGNHLWPLDKIAKAAWLEEVVTELGAFI